MSSFFAAARSAGLAGERRGRERSILIRFILQMLAFAGLCVGATLYVQARFFAPTAAPRIEEETLRVQAIQGVGALGRIEPRSRLIHVSNEAAGAGGVVGEMLVREGQVIKAGGRIAVLTDWDRRRAEVALSIAEIASANARLQAADAELNGAQRDYDRKKSLFKTGFVTQYVMEGVELRLKRARADVDAAHASVQQGEANLQLKRLHLSQAISTAPIDGVIIKINARPGERIGPEGVVDMADLNNLDVVAEVYESDIPRIKIGQKATVKLAGEDASFEAEVRELAFAVRKSRVNDTDPLADRDNKVVEVRLSLQGRAVEELQHQLFRQVQVRIEP
jgi:HlyD family secretion protein